jgi:hypothetical protein
MRYIATRDGVEILPREGYLRYMATRPGADAHGLFGDHDAVNLNTAMSEIAQHSGNVWTHIISLRREDAARLGFDSADSWRNLLKTHRNDMAAAMKIQPQDFRWYAAFHNEGEHPHVHMMAWSAKENDGYLSKKGITEIRSKLTNSVFQHEMLHLYQQKSISRDTLVKQGCKDIRRLARGIEIEPACTEHISQLMNQLAERLSKLSGKKQYGYLPKGTKKLVDQIVDKLAAQPSVKACYDTWWQYKQSIDGYYSGAVSEQLPLSKQKEFKTIRNAVVYEAAELAGFEMTYLPQQAAPVLPAVARLLKNISRIFEDNAPQLPNRQRHQIDRKLLQKMREKKLAQGHAQDEHTMDY